MNHYLRLTPRDPVIARDGRPFGVGQGNRMRGLNWIQPSLLTGSFRSALGKQWFKDFDSRTALEAVVSVSAAGPFPLVHESLYLPAPSDCLLDNQNQLHALRPEALSAGEGTDGPTYLEPVVLSSDVDDFKPAKMPAWWSVQSISRWLIASNLGDLAIDDQEDDQKDDQKHFLKSPGKDLRVHVEIDPKTLAAKDERLFATEGLELDGKKPWELAARITMPSESHLSFSDDVQPLGGERRLVGWKREDESLKALWECPPEVRKALESAPLIRMMLATPGIFSCGWRPGWLKNVNDLWQGVVPGTQVEVRLVGAVVERWQAVSGYAYRAPTHEVRPDRKVPETEQRLHGPGPKPIRRLAPAGSMYFFEVLNADQQNPSQLADAWLQPVCDLNKDCQQGFGLAVWGIWDRRPSPKGTSLQ